MEATAQKVTNRGYIHIATKTIYTNLCIVLCMPVDVSVCWLKKEKVWGIFDDDALKKMNLPRKCTPFLER